MSGSCVRCRRDWGSGSGCCPNCGGVSREEFDEELLAADGGETSTEEEEENIDPLATVDGETEVEITCAVAIDAPRACEGWSETVELDKPANYVGGRIELPGFEWECPECGNPHEFEVDGMRVTNLA